MYPQTHVYFSKMLLGRTSDAIILGSLLPDMVIGPQLNHIQSHSLGPVLYQLFQQDQELMDFVRGVVSHGTVPRGLDYFGDEQYPNCQRGYCFEKALPLIQDTIAACNLPPRMGWWKAHNIIEMGIEVHISQRGQYGQLIRRALQNKKLINRLGTVLAPVTGYSAHWFKSRSAVFENYIEIFNTTPQTLARKYHTQTLMRHQIEINIPRVTRLIETAMELVANDLDRFFAFTQEQVAQEIKQLKQQAAYG